MTQLLMAIAVGRRNRVERSDIVGLGAYGKGRQDGVE